MFANEQYHLGLFEAFFVAAVVLIILVINFELKKRQRFKGITGTLPTVYGLPVVGYLYKWIPLTKFFTSFEQTFNEFNCSTFFTFFANKPMLITIDPEIVKQVLTSDNFLSKARSLYGAIDRAIPKGLITTNGEEWRHNRKLLNLSFSHSVLANFMPAFNSAANRTVKMFQLMVGRGEQEIFYVIKKTVFHIAFETTMGIPLKQENSLSDEEIVRDFNFLIGKVSNDAVLSALNLGGLVRSPKYFKTIKQFRNHIKKILTNGSWQNNESMLRSETDIRKCSDIFICQAMDFQRKGLFKQYNVISESLTMLAGTFETVSTTLYSLLVLIAMHPEVQAKLFDEIHEVLPNKNTEIEFKHLKQIPYTDMVLYETLRLMPSIPFIGREITTDTWLSIDLLLPKNIQIAIPVFNLHRSKDIWGPNANAFDPNNFLPSVASKRHPYAYIPFSKGWRYAHIILRVLTMHLVRNFKFSTNFKYDDLVFLQKLSLRYEKEPLIQIESRS